MKYFIINFDIFNILFVIVLNEKISVSQCRKKEFEKDINGKKYKCYSVFYPVGNGRFNIGKSIEDINYIIDNINDKIVV